MDDDWLTVLPGLLIASAVIFFAISWIWLCCAFGDGAKATGSCGGCCLAFVGCLAISAGSSVLAAYGHKADIIDSYAYFGKMRIVDYEIVERQIEGTNCHKYGVVYNATRDIELVQNADGKWVNDTCNFLLQQPRVTVDWGYGWACPGQDNNNDKQCVSQSFLPGVNCTAVVCHRIAPVRPSTWHTSRTESCTEEARQDALVQADACASDQIFNRSAFANTEYRAARNPNDDYESNYWPVVELYGDCSTCSVRVGVPSVRHVENLRKAGLGTLFTGVVFLVLSFLGCWLGWRKVSPIRKANNDNRMLLQVKKNGMLLQKATLEQQKDLEIVMAAIRQNALAIQYAHWDLRNRIDVATEAVKVIPYAFKFVSEELQDDLLWVIKNIVDKDGELLQYASQRLKNNRDVVLVAVQQSGMALQFASTKLRADKEVVRVAIQQNPEAIRFAPQPQQKDEEDVSQELQQDEEEFFYSCRDQPETLL